MRLRDIARCFEGVVPATIATCDASGVPNVAVLSHVHVVDDQHVALSRQFFNKTTRNILENPRAVVNVFDPITMESYDVHVRFVRSETQGALFESMSARIDAIAAHTGMAGVFRLLAADVCRVLRVEEVKNFLRPLQEAGIDDLHAGLDETTQPPAERSELWALHRISQRMNQARSGAALGQALLEGLRLDFGFPECTLMTIAGPGRALSALAAASDRGHALCARLQENPALLDALTRDRRPLRFSGLRSDLRYGQAIKRSLAIAGAARAPHASAAEDGTEQSVLSLPLVRGDELMGLLVVHSDDVCVFALWHEAFLSVVANQIAAALAALDHAPPAPASPAVGAAKIHNLVYYRNDDCLFVDGEYLVRNIPARILRKLLLEFKRAGRSDFSNRELRLDPDLGLPDVKDNLESRLILLRKRLEERCAWIRISSRGRGRFSLTVDGGFELEEKDTAGA